MSEAASTPPEPAPLSLTPLTRHDLYERCVVSPEQLVPLLRAIHAGQGAHAPRHLAEDFAGTACLCDRWVADVPGGTSTGVDLDAEALHYHPLRDGVTKIQCDVRDDRLLDPSQPRADIVHAGNFSIGYMHSRADLVDYLSRARKRLADGGVFLCDTYGGESTFITGAVHRDHWIADGPHKGKRIRYTWEQRDADPLTGMVTDVLHFRVEVGGVIHEAFFDAFVYRWRLWSVPELRDAMLEAGFARTDVYAKLPGAVDTEGNAYISPVTDPDELDDSFIGMVAGR